MKLLTNAKALIKVINSLFSMAPYKRKIDTLRKEGKIKEEQKLIVEAENFWGNYLVDKFKINIEVIGEENLNTKSPRVYIFNHQSYFDVITFLSITKEPVGYIAKKEFRKVPILGNWLNRIHCLFINRSNVKDSLRTINKGKVELDNGFSMAIFPEGTRSRSDSMGYFHKGSFKLATNGQYPIIPITLIGTSNIYEKTGVAHYNQNVKIIIHEPIITKGLSKEEERLLPEKVSNIISESLKNS